MMFVKLSHTVTVTIELVGEVINPRLPAGVDENSVGKVVELVVACVYIDSTRRPGFISIDCGIPRGFSYTDATTGLNYASDSSFIDTGTNATISPEYQTTGLEQQFLTLRSFPQGIRNCYTIRPSEGKGNKYLIRARFFYGNYDEKNQPPNFDLHLGVDFWDSINIVNASTPDLIEIIHVLSSDFVQVCLVNSGRGTPFISALELRPFSNIHTYETVSGSLQTIFRRDFGSASTQFVRYPDDVYDRMWMSFSDEQSMRSVSTSSTIDSSGYSYNPPSKVMTTAVAAPDGTDGLVLPWKPKNSTDQHYLYMHFAEIETNKNKRQFNISLNDVVFQEGLALNYLRPITVYSLSAIAPSAKNQISLERTGNSTLPPIINAMEIYKVVNIMTSQTYDLDVEAIMNIKSTYGIKRNWQGDPCGPKADIWIGLICNSDPPRIISLNLSTSELAGTISPDIANLTKLESLDLSNNALIGEVPQVLSQLTFLRVLNLKGNDFSGQLPSELRAKSKDGSLLLSIDEPVVPSNNSHVETKNKKLSATALVSIGASAVVLVLLALLLVVWIFRRSETERKKRSISNPLELKNRQFTYSEILHITNNFQKILGKGGFGTVYHGYIGDREVAVKMLSPSSAQGFRAFQAEASLLMSIHHKNLISVVGYCVEDAHIGIICEYMENGSLDKHLSGLEYLHHGCEPPVIHRDVKPSNILLDDKLQGKLADFGLSRTLPTPGETHLTTIVAGTPGYLDPEYYRSNKLTKKSDVYSFGVVLLEIITGRHSLGLQDNIHVITWVNGKLENGDITKIMDPRLPGHVDESSMRKAVELAMACVSLDPTTRPVMSVVVSKLKECLSQIN